jgi:N4-gp56 family major capsid protein
MGLGSDHITGTTINNWRPNIWASEVLAARESALVLANLVKRYDRDVATKGKTVEIPNLSNLTAHAKVANSQVTLNDPTEGKTTITIDQHWEASVLIEDFAEVQSAYDAAREYREKTGYAIAEKMDNFIADDMTTNFTESVGTYGTGIAYGDVLDAKQKLDEAKAPMTERYFVVTPKGHRDLLEIDEFVRYDAMGAASQPSGYRTGRVGMILGNDVFMSQNLVVTAGTPTENNCLFFHKEAYALAVQTSPKTEMQRKTEYLGDLIVTQALWGGHVLRDDHGVVVKC